MAEPVERIPQHRHCRVCGRAFVGDGVYCGGACKEKKAEELRRERRKLLAIWAVAAALMVGAFVWMGAAP